MKLKRKLAKLNPKEKHLGIRIRKKRKKRKTGKK